jgi:hypothetical protein
VIGSSRIAWTFAGSNESGVDWFLSTCLNSTGPHVKGWFPVWQQFLQQCKHNESIAHSTCNQHHIVKSSHSVEVPRVRSNGNINCQLTSTYGSVKFELN